MQQIHKIIASLTPEHDGTSTSLGSHLCVFLVVFHVQDTSSSFGNNAMSGTQVAALFIGMETERGYRRRA